MAAERKKKTTVKKQSKPEIRPKAAFDPDRPFAEGVRGAESYYIQDGIEYLKWGSFPRGLIDG